MCSIDELVNQLTSHKLQEADEEYEELFEAYKCEETDANVNVIVHNARFRYQRMLNSNMKLKKIASDLPELIKMFFEKPIVKEQFELMKRIDDYIMNYLDERYCKVQSEPDELDPCDEEYDDSDTFSDESDYDVMECE